MKKKGSLIGKKKLKFIILIFVGLLVATLCLYFWYLEWQCAVREQIADIDSEIARLELESLEFSGSKNATNWYLRAYDLLEAYKPIDPRSKEHRIDVGQIAELVTKGNRIQGGTFLWSHSNIRLARYSALITDIFELMAEEKMVRGNPESAVCYYSELLNYLSRTSKSNKSVALSVPQRQWDILNALWRWIMNSDVSDELLQQLSIEIKSCYQKIPTFGHLAALEYHCLLTETLKPNLEIALNGSIWEKDFWCGYNSLRSVPRKIEEFRALTRNVFIVQIQEANHNSYNDFSQLILRKDKYLLFDPEVSVSEMNLWEELFLRWAKVKSTYMLLLLGIKGLQQKQAEGHITFKEIEEIGEENRLIIDPISGQSLLSLLKKHDNSEVLEAIGVAIVALAPGPSVILQPSADHRK